MSITFYTPGSIDGTKRLSFDKATIKPGASAEGYPVWTRTKTMGKVGLDRTGGSRASLACCIVSFLPYPNHLLHRLTSSREGARRINPGKGDEKGLHDLLCTGATDSSIRISQWLTASYSSSYTVADSVKPAAEERKEIRLAVLRGRVCRGTSLSPISLAIIFRAGTFSSRTHPRSRLSSQTNKNSIHIITQVFDSSPLPPSQLLCGTISRFHQFNQFLVNF